MIYLTIQGEEAFKRFNNNETVSYEGHSLIVNPIEINFRNGTRSFTLMLMKKCTQDT